LPTNTIQNISPFLWFDGNADEALDFYLSVFPEAKLLRQLFYGANSPLPEGSLMTASLLVGGQEFTLLNGPGAPPPSHLVSFVVPCDSQAEIDYFWEKLGQGGQNMACGWLTDRFGITWQVVPANIAELMAGPDDAATQRVRQALWGMQKLDIAALEAAKAGKEVAA